MELAKFWLMVFTNFVLYEKYEINSAFLADVLDIMDKEPTKAAMENVPEGIKPKKEFMWEKRHNIVDVVWLVEHSIYRKPPPEYSYEELKTACSELATTLSIDSQATPTDKKIDVGGNRYQATKCDLIVPSVSGKITFKFYLIAGPVLFDLGQIWYLSTGEKYGEVDIFVYDVKCIFGKSTPGKMKPVKDPLLTGITIYKNTFNYYFSSIKGEISNLITKRRKENKYKLVSAAEAECYNGEFILKKNVNIIQKSSNELKKVGQIVKDHEKVQTLVSKMRKGKEVVKNNTLGKVEIGFKKGNELARSESKRIMDTGNKLVKSGSKKITDTKEMVQNIASNSVTTGKEKVMDKFREIAQKHNYEKIRDETSSEMRPLISKDRGVVEKGKVGEKGKNEGSSKRFAIQNQNQREDWEEYPLLERNQGAEKRNRKSEKVSNSKRGESKDQKTEKDGNELEKEKDLSKYYTRSSSRK